MKETGFYIVPHARDSKPRWKWQWKKEDRPMAEKTERERERERKKIVTKCITHWRYLSSAYDLSYGSRKTRR